ncbi:mitochondrial protein Pet127-domain-containing protein [Xylariaceae sp. FL1272]|nr:mitochondrial protein Pet127-domain-containing protein [Xylariaceae sp. FL1272]
MLRFSRSSICRASSYCTCASYQTASLSSYASHLRLRRAASQHYIRRLATDASKTATDSKAISPPQPSPTATSKPSAPSETTPDTSKPSKPAKKKNKKKPTKAKASAKPLPQGTERKLVVLEGALEALKNVLTTKGIDVGQALCNAAPNSLLPSGSSPASVKKSQKTSRKPPATKKAKVAKKAQSARQQTEEQTEDVGSALNTERRIEKSSSKMPKKRLGKRARARKQAQSAKQQQTKEEVEEDIGRGLENSSHKMPSKRNDESGMNPSRKLSAVGSAKKTTNPGALSPSSDEIDFVVMRTMHHNLGLGDDQANTIDSFVGVTRTLSKKKAELSDHELNTKSQDLPMEPIINRRKGIVPKKRAAKEPMAERIKPEENEKRRAVPISKLSPMTMALEPIDIEKPPVPPLTYGLDRVLFNSGVYQLQDPHTDVFNFDPYLSKIMPISEFDFNALKQYVTSSKDTNLISIAKENKKKYTGSTSSMTSMLSHFHYILSAFRPLNYSMLSRRFNPESDRFTHIMRAPAATFLHWKDGTYAIDADKEFDTANVLSMLGKSMEKLLTLPKGEYERYRHENSDQITEEERNAEEAFHFTSFGDFMMRSQLDAYDPRVPGSGMFDLKTRAVVSIRMDVQGFEKGLDYEIRHKLGQWESFEREYYDMIRSAFLKYSLQVRMGRMDGIFVAYHNIKRIFGFQYVSLREMDESLHGGSTNLVLGDAEFKASLRLLNELLNRATEKWPEQSLSIVVETRESTKNGGSTPFMYIFAKPVSAADIKQKQEKGKAKIEAYERKLLGLVNGGETVPSENPAVSEAVANEDQTPLSPAAEELISVATWDEAREMVQNAMDDDEQGVGLVREAIEDALEQSNILRTTSSAEAREYVDALIETLTGHSLAAPWKTGENDIDEGENDNELEEDDMQVDHNDSPRDMDKVIDEVKKELEAGEEGATQDCLNESKKALKDDQVFEEATNPASSMPAESNPAPTTDETNLDGDIATLDEINVVSDIDGTHATRSFATSDGKEEEIIEEEPEDEEDEEDESEDDIAASDTKEDAASARLAPLTDLIVRMAQRIDERPTGVVGSRDFGDDASRLKIFEQTLTRLISGSKSVETHKEDGSTDVDTRQETTSSDIAATEETQPKTTDSADATAESDTSVTPAESPKIDLLAMVLTVKNKVNGKYVTRPENLQKADDWTVEYIIQEVEEPERALGLYQQCIKRRKAAFTFSDRDAAWYEMFRGELARSTNAGREYRKEKEKTDRSSPMYTVDSTAPLPRGKPLDSAEQPTQ